MDTIEFDKLFEPSNKSVLDFFRVSGAGYYIPEYQRSYSWDKDNVNQLLTDIAEGVERLDNNNSEEEIHFLGTIITVVDPSNKNKDPKGKPTKIEMIIDGQQRVITISIIASIFAKALINCLGKFKASSPVYGEVKEIVATWNKKLMDIVSFDLLRGKPRLKPKIIRGGSDYWTAEDPIEDAYKSDLALYEARFIDAYLKTENGGKADFPEFKSDSNYALNAKRVEQWLNKDVSEAHNNGDEKFSNASDIVNRISQDMLWDYDRPMLQEIIENHFSGEQSRESSSLCSLVQIIAACYYLLERCCFCVIRPANEDWAFDMFQSLNATGTPLTALETFKPVVINYFKSNKITYKDSETEKYLKKVEDFLSAPNTAVQKTRRTNDYIVSFFVSYRGEKVPTHFSGERKALVKNYNELNTIEEKNSFIKKMGDYSDFYDLWLKFNGEKSFKLNDINEESDLISLLILFLKNSNHRMAITTLGSIYQKVLDKEESADKEFIDVVKATTAFYFLWRTYLSNNGLDVVYRNFFQNKFEEGKPVSTEDIKKHFASALCEKNIMKNDWKNKASQTLKYNKNNKDLVKLALLISSTDTVPDTVTKGSVKPGKPGTSDYLKLKYWLSDDLNTIEHIAPQTNQGTWDENLYDQDTMYVNSIGNLTLLPIDINASVGNKSFQEKLLYYKCVGEEDPAVLAKLDQKAKTLGISLSDTTVEKLKNCKYSHHIQPLSTLDYCDSWKADLVKKRTNAILDIIWDRLMSWIE